jgi:Fur family ferric uptake transcriptional regulator
MKNQEIEKKLESKNVKPTAMRTLVYKALADSREFCNKLYN